MQRLWIGLGALSGFKAVVIAAFMAHGLGWLDPAALRMVRSANDMQIWHALALVAVGVWAPRGGMLADLAGAAFLAGSVLFCGAVYLVGLTGVGLGPVAPTGGVLLMLGWLLLAASALRVAGPGAG